MKKAGSSKSISSPGRADKFPPPLMRFLRSNVGSKSSRGRTTRASPMMFLRKNKNHVPIETTQEPSSPKVTCIGQVRVRRSSKGSRSCSTRRSISVRKQQKQDTNNQRKRPCCCNLPVKLHNPSSLFLAFKKVVCCFQFKHCGKKVDSSSSRVESTERVQSHRVSTSSSISNTTESIDNVGVVTGGKESFVSSVANPPKDALILTRCRSAPYRSSSLASRFWGSPLNHSDTSPKSQSPQKHCQELEEEVVRPLPPVLETPILPEGENGDLESRKSNESEEMQSSINEGSRKDEEINGGGAYVHPLLLTRCKSEPARTGERLNPTRFSELESQS